jgi:Ca2+-binding RTX toxin-like protein
LHADVSWQTFLWTKGIDVSGRLVAVVAVVLAALLPATPAAAVPPTTSCSLLDRVLEIETDASNTEGRYEILLLTSKPASETEPARIEVAVETPFEADAVTVVECGVLLEEFDSISALMTGGVPAVVIDARAASFQRLNADDTVEDIDITLDFGERLETVGTVEFRGGTPTHAVAGRLGIDLANDGDLDVAWEADPAYVNMFGSNAADQLSLAGGPATGGGLVPTSALYGLGGNDVLRGGWSYDTTLFGGDGADTLVANPDADGREDFRGGNGRDTVTYARSPYAVRVSLDGVPNDGWKPEPDYPGEQDNVRPDVERIVGSRFADTMSGSTGFNTLDGGPGADTIRGGAGHDRLMGGASSDLILGGTGYDTLTGGAGNDVLKGESDADILYGNDGDDTLNGGANADECYGGAGADTRSYCEMW